MEEEARTGFNVVKTTTNNNAVALYHTHPTFFCVSDKPHQGSPSATAGSNRRSGLGGVARWPNLLPAETAGELALRRGFSRHSRALPQSKRVSVTHQYTRPLEGFGWRERGTV